MNRLFTILLTGCLFLNIYSQNIDNESIQIVETIREFYDNQLNEQDINNLIEIINYHRENPVSINNATKKILENIPFLNDEQIENILYYRYLYGDMKSVNELSYVPSIDMRTFLLIKSFFFIEEGYEHINDKVVNKRLIMPKSNLLITIKSNINKKEGYVDKPDSILLLNSNKMYLYNRLYTSIRFNSEIKDKVKVGFVIEKDPGERWNDYFSLYIRVMNIGIIDNITFGNYKASFGLGLVINNGFSLGKSFTLMNMNSNRQGVTVHNSVDEHNYLQGISAKLKLSNLLLTPFFSFRSLDAIRANDTVTSIKKDGLHNLVREENKRNKVHITTSGINLHFQLKYISLGITAVYNHLNYPYFPALKEYNLYYFRGKNNFNMSVNYQYRYRKICFRGETAFDQNAKIATLNLLSFSPVDYLNMMFVQRYYHKEYNAWFGKSYSEGSMINNEQGYTLILKYNPIRNLIVDLGVDYFSFPWLKYGIDHPSDGFDIFSKISYAIAEKTYLSLYYRIKIKEKNYNTIASENVSDVIDTNVDNVEIVENSDEITDEEDTDPMFAERKRTARNYKNTFTFNMKNIISEHFYGNTVFSMILYKEKLKSLSKGMMLAQSIGYKLKNFDLFFSCAIFDTDDYYSRTYFSDRSLPYSFSIPSLSGNGILFSMNIGFKLFSSLSIYIKAANIHYFDRNEIGTSLEKIYGCNKTDLGIAMRYKF